MQDKNPRDTEKRIRNVLETIDYRFGSGKKGSLTNDTLKFAEMLAIEAQFGEPLIDTDINSVD